MSVTLHSIGGTTTEIRVGQGREVGHGPPQGRSLPAAAPPAVPNKIIQAASGQAMSVYGGTSTPGAKLSLWDYSASTSMTWLVVTGQHDQVTIQSVRSGLVVEAPGDAQAGTVLEQQPSGTGANQRWRLVDAGGGQVRIVGVNDLVIGVVGSSTTRGAFLETQVQSTDPTQLWTISKA